MNGSYSLARTRHSVFFSKIITFYISGHNIFTQSSKYPSPLAFTDIFTDSVHIPDFQPIHIPAQFGLDLVIEPHAPVLFGGFARTLVRMEKLFEQSDIVEPRPHPDLEIVPYGTAFERIGSRDHHRTSEKTGADRYIPRIEPIIFPAYNPGATNPATVPVFPCCRKQALYFHFPDNGCWPDFPD